MASTTTLSRKRASASDTVRPSRSGKAKAKGAEASLTPVWWKGSAGSPSPWARGLAGTRAGKVAEHELAIAPAAIQRAGVAIHAQDRGGDFGALLAHDEAPGRFPFRAFGRDLPKATNIRHAVGAARRRRRRGARGRGTSATRGRNVLPTRPR